MFKKFNASEDVAGRQNVKSSVQRGIKAKITETFPKLEPYLEEIIPKKSQLSLVKWYSPAILPFRPLCTEKLTFNSRDHISLLALDNEVYIPSLRLVHKCT
jgi:PUA domain protein